MKSEERLRARRAEDIPIAEIQVIEWEEECGAHKISNRHAHALRDGRIG